MSLNFPIGMMKKPTGGFSPTAFVTTHTTTGTSQTIQIALNTYSTLDVDWGDGSTVETITTGTYISHVYTLAGVYDVAVEVVSARPRMSVSTSKLKITDIKQWGTCAWTRFDGAFLGCTNMTITATDSLVLPSLSSTAFKDCPLANPDTTLWDTSSAITIREMFRNSGITTPDVSGWDTSNVTDMYQVFYSSTAFNSDISAWNLTKVTTMYRITNSAVFSTANLDAFYISADAQLVKNSVPFGAIGTQYSAGAAATARANLIADHSWTLTDGGPV